MLQIGDKMPSFEVIDQDGKTVTWDYGSAAVAMTCLFLFISIPMMERRQLDNKPGYAESRKQTRILI